MRAASRRAKAASATFANVHMLLEQSENFPPGLQHLGALCARKAFQVCLHLLRCTLNVVQRDCQQRSFADRQPIVVLLLLFIQFEAYFWVHASSLLIAPPVKEMLFRSATQTNREELVELWHMHCKLLLTPLLP
jgi:hypothetical protein